MYTQIFCSHLDWYLDHAVWPEQAGLGGLWWSMLDLRTGQPPEGERAAGVAKRCYRSIESPRGSNLYWDGPLVVACCEMSRRTGRAKYAEAAHRYVRRYLDVAASPGGLIWWGNHYYVSRDDQGPVVFVDDRAPVPVDASHASAPLHETRPLPVPWELLWTLEPERTRRALAAHAGHLVEGCERGCFNRHADGRRSHAFLEAGGLLALSQAWLARLTGDAQAAQRCREVADFSWSFRDPGTGLLPVSPVASRWDRDTATSETGLWSGALLAAASLLDDDVLRSRASEALEAWLVHAWCGSAGRYQGRTLVTTGQHDAGPKSTIYQPGTWSDPWNPLFPTHDYPLQAAHACLESWLATKQEAFRAGCQRWASVLAATTPAANGAGAYAESYGRAIHFLWRAGQALECPQWSRQASDLAGEALAILGRGEQLASHPWEPRVEAVDGMGWLMLALLCLESGREPSLHGLFW